MRSERISKSSTPGQQTGEISFERPAMFGRVAHGHAVIKFYQGPALDTTSSYFLRKETSKSTDNFSLSNFIRDEAVLR